MWRQKGKGEKKKDEKKGHLESVYYHLIYPEDIKSNIQQIQKRVPGASLSSSLGISIQLPLLDTWFRVGQWKKTLQLKFHCHRPMVPFLLQLGPLSLFLLRQRRAEQAPLQCPAGPYTSWLQSLFLVPFSWAINSLTCFLDFPGQQLFPWPIRNTNSCFRSV